MDILPALHVVETRYLKEMGNRGRVGLRSNHGPGSGVPGPWSDQADGLLVKVPSAYSTVVRRDASLCAKYSPRSLSASTLLNALRVEIRPIPLRGERRLHVPDTDRIFLVGQAPEQVGRICLLQA